MLAYCSMQTTLAGVLLTDDALQSQAHCSGEKPRQSPSSYQDQHSLGSPGWICSPDALFLSSPFHASLAIEDEG